MAQGPRTLSIATSKCLGSGFWVSWVSPHIQIPNFKVLGFQGLVTIKLLRSWVFCVSLHIKISRSWVSKVLRQITILMSWVSRVPRQKGRARSKVHQGPRPWIQRTQDLGSFWDLGTSLITVSVKTPSVSSLRKYSTSKLTCVQNFSSPFLNIGPIDLWCFIACGLVNTVDLILPSLNVRWTFE